MRKRSKKIVLMNAIFIVASFSLITFGFASWIVDGSVDVDSDNVSVTISDSKDETLLIEFVNNNDTDLSVCFDSNGSSQSAKLPGEGFYITSDGSKEDLTFTLTYELVSFDNIYNSSKIKISIDFTNSEAFSVLSSPTNYIDITSINDFSFTLNNPYSSSNNEKTYVETIITNNQITTSNLSYYVINITQKFTFYWGSVFNGVNPGDNNSTSVEDLLNFIEVGKTLSNTKLEVLITGERI